ncbi:hypothetical protein [Undibacterium sp.]|uniref:hypothetical protein n=1 Tax=Undibacterium sp. TaxID=1914977 RepID=UPI00272B83D4|nr:hypothetical protein [Undibacterium sp.]
MRDSKDHTTLELPGFDLVSLPSIVYNKKSSVFRNTKPRTNIQSQLELLAPLGPTDHTGLPIWIQDSSLDQSGLPIWATSPETDNISLLLA